MTLILYLDGADGVRKKRRRAYNLESLYYNAAAFGSKKTFLEMTYFLEKIL
jgi:hypothetical protein